MFKPYESKQYFDEMLENNKPKSHYKAFYEKLSEFSED